MTYVFIGFYIQNILTKGLPYDGFYYLVGKLIDIHLSTRGVL